MSKYTQKFDFKDVIDIFFNNDWTKLKNSTKIYIGASQQLKLEQPAELIPYYSYTIDTFACTTYSDYIEYTIHLKQDYTDLLLKNTLEFNLWSKKNNFKYDLNYIKQQKQELKKLYEEESKKPNNKQKIR